MPVRFEGAGLAVGGRIGQATVNQRLAQTEHRGIMLNVLVWMMRLKPKAPGTLYQRALAAFQQLKENMQMGWNAADDPNRELSQTELAAPLAIELERTIVAALQQIGVSLL